MRSRALLLPSFLLLAACSQTAVTQQAEPLKLTRKAYDARDFIVAQSSLEEHDRKLNELTDLITSSVAPASWHSIQYADQPAVQKANATSNAGIGTFNDTLIITQTPAIHAEIDALLAQLRAAENLQVSVEVRLLFVDKSYVENAESDPRKGDVTFDNFVTSLLIRSTQTDGYSVNLSAPRATMLSSNSAHLGFKQTAAFTTIDRGPLSPVAPAPMKDGYEIDFHATVAPDHKTVHMQFMSSFTARVADVTIPDRTTLILRADPWTDPFTTPVTNPKGLKGDRILLIMIRPTILEYGLAQR